MAGIPSSIQRTVEGLFMEFTLRRRGLLHALTTEKQKLYDQCDPAKENLCLYGLPHGTWEVKPPSDLPYDHPEPVLGINFARDGIPEKDWLRFVALHSDSWLIAMAFYFCGSSGFSKSERAELFRMINDLPTLVEVVSGQINDNPTIGDSKEDHQSPNHNSNKRKSNGAGQSSKSGAHTKALNMSPVPTMEEDEEESDEESLGCGVCGHDLGDNSWIGCDFCVRWYHGICVKITPEEEKLIKSYRCPSCCDKKTRV